MGQIKISQLTPKDAPLSTSDLLIIAEETSDGFESKSVTGAEIIESAQEGLQPLLVSGTSIKTINGTSLLGSGDIAITASASWGSITGTLSTQTDLQGALDSKQATLVSGTNIKTINGNSLLGSGDITISGSNIYNADGTLTGARTLTLGGVALTIAGTTSSRFQANGNLGIGTTTDAGFKLDVNGTGAFRSTLSFLPPLLSTAQTAINVYRGASTSIIALSIGITSGDDAIFNTANADYIFNRSNVERFRIGNTSITTNYQINPKVTIPTGTTINYGLNLSNAAGAQRMQLGIDASENAVVTLGNLCDYRIRNLASSGYDVLNINGSTGNVVIEKIATTSTAIPSAKLALNSTTSGFLPPRMTTAQKNAIASPAAGLVVYDTTLNKLCVYTTTWETITSA